MGAPDWRSIPHMTRLADEAAKRGRVFTQTMFDFLWDYARSRSVDPLFCLGILNQEGNGSFNTSAANPAGDGGHGFEVDWEKDVRRAVDLVRGKLAFYAQARAQGWADLARKVAGEDANPYMWANWYNPILRNNGSVDAGVYAQHGSWWRGVKAYHIRFGGTLAEMEACCAALDKQAPRIRMTFRVVVDETRWASNWNATAPEPAVIVTSYEVTGPPPAVVEEVAPAVQTIPVTVIIDGVEVACNATNIGGWAHANLEPFLLLLQRYGVDTSYDWQTRTLTLATPTTP
jgi:hypothetical protein